MANIISEVRFGERPVPPISVVYISEDDTARERTYLAAAVVWRASAAPRRRSPFGWLRRLRRWFGPFGIGLSIGREAGHWSGVEGADGEQTTLYHAGRRIVRVLGRNHRLPGEEQTLVLLIDATVRGRPVVARRILSAPSMPLRAAGEGEVWRVWLEDDEGVREFLRSTA
jgi:hypothetical protein